MQPVEKVRIDKWLWCVRIYKSRTLAGDAVREGKVKVNGLVVKPSGQVAVGEIVMVKKDGFNLQFKVLQLLEKRVGAPLAALAYEDLTPAEEKNKYESWFTGAPSPERREKGMGRPTKKERREIDRYKDY